MGTRLSHSAVRLYSQCGKRYYYHYLERLRPNVISGALIFGSAIDQALNDLLINKDLPKAIKTFHAAFEIQTINGGKTHIPTSPKVVYAKTDYDPDLSSDLGNQYAGLAEKKQESGYDSLTPVEKQLFALINYSGMLRKGEIMLEAYAREILPQIKQVLAIQKNVALKNEQGDEVIAYIDLIVEWKDGKRYLLDNKTSTRDYTQDSARKSQQLLLYYHMCKDEYKIDGGVGFIVLYKQIQKNRVKICSVCGFDGSGGRHKTCNNEIANFKTIKELGTGLGSVTRRCEGAWKETIDPKARIEVILNPVPETAENLILDVFDGVNRSIKAGLFIPNPSACGDGEWQCPYYKKCWQGKDDALVKV